MIYVSRRSPGRWDCHLNDDILTGAKFVQFLYSVPLVIMVIIITYLVICMTVDINCHNKNGWLNV
jgi:hypothetical protein